MTTNHLRPVSQAQKRLQDIIMKLFRYDIDFQFVKGSDLIIADTLSHVFVKTNNKDEM